MKNKMSTEQGGWCVFHPARALP